MDILPAEYFCFGESMFSESEQLGWKLSSWFYLKPSYQIFWSPPSWGFVLHFKSWNNTNNGTVEVVVKDLFATVKLN